MDDLIAFLRAQWDAEELTARRITATRHGALIVAPGDGEQPSVFEVRADALLADIAMKRRLLDDAVKAIGDADGIGLWSVTEGEFIGAAQAYKTVLKQLAEPYASEDGYQEEWRL